MDVPALIVLQAELLADGRLRTDEAHGQDGQVTRPFTIRARQLLDACAGDFDLLCHQRLEHTIFPPELRRHHTVRARVVPEDRCDFRMTIVNAVNAGPLRPRVAGCP